MKELFETGLLNVSKLAFLLWPEKSKASAASCLHNKINGINGNSITIEDKKNIKNILNRLLIKNIPKNCEHLQEGSLAIYKLVFKGSDFIYIGSTNNPEQRHLSHIARMKLGKHHCKKLNKMFLEFGSPKIEILDYCNYDNYKKLEQELIYKNKMYCCNTNAAWYLKEVKNNLK